MGSKSEMIELAGAARETERFQLGRMWYYNKTYQYSNWLASSSLKSSFPNPVPDITKLGGTTMETQ